MKVSLTLVLGFSLLPHSAGAQAAQGLQEDSGKRPQIGQFVLYAERSIRLGERSHTDDGDVGVRTRLGAKGAGDQLIVGEHAKCRNVFAPSIRLRNDSKARNVWTDALNKDPDSEMGMQNKFPAAAMPALPLALASGTGDDVTVDEHKSRILSPGAYGVVTLYKRSTLRLAAGKYSFATLKMGERSNLLGDRKGVDVRIVGELHMANHAGIAAQGDDAKARDFTIAVAGRDPTTIGGSSLGVPDNRVAPTTVVSIGKESRVHALLVAPHGTIWLAEESSVKGALAGFDIVAGERVHAEFENGFPASPPDQTGSQQLHGYYGVDPDASKAPLVGPVPSAARVALSIGLPVRDPQGLKSFVKQVSDPKSPNFRKHLSQAQFYSTYGATDADYQALKNWANSAHGFTISATYPNHLLLSVSATAAQIEQALYANLIYRQRPDGSKFVTVDREPSLDLTVPILEISGFNDYILPHSRALHGTGSGGSYRAEDLRNAYLGVGSSCQKLDGSMQVVGIVDWANFDPNDIAGYDALQLPALNPALVKVVAMEGGNPPTNSAGEATLDVELVQAMAPNAQILFFQGSSLLTGHLDDVLQAMATSTPPLTVASCSLGFGRSNISQQALNEMAAQGVSFFTASGDFGDIGDPQSNDDMDDQTLVGGTFLATNPLTIGLPSPVYPSNYYSGETTWNEHPGTSDQSFGVSSGGIMDGNNHGGGTIFSVPPTGCMCWPQSVCCGSGVPIPDYQSSVSMTANGGSTQWRNYPDVSMLAENAEIFFQGSSNPTWAGTSLAAPLWAGFTALADQQSMNNSAGLLGFINPTIYDIGLTSGTSNNLYSVSFNDIQDGVSNANGFGSGFKSVAGYDLVTGWGSPTCGLINQLSSSTPLAPNQPLSLIEFVISTGMDDLRPNGGVASGCNGTGATADVLLQDGSSFTVTLKNKGTSEAWAEGWVQKMDFPIPNTVSPPLTATTGIAGVRINIQEDWVFPCGPDNWDISKLNVALFNVGSPKVCQLDLIGNSSLQDGTTGLVRLSSSAGSSGVGPSTTFMTSSNSGCPP